MKVNITICLDHDLVHKLRQEGNMSQTINDLLQNHLFGAGTKEGIEKAINEKKDLIDKATKDVEELQKRLIKANKPTVRVI